MRLPALCGLILLAACEPTVTLPVKVRAIVPSRSNNYETRQVELTTPTSLVHLSGPVISLIGGAVVEINPSDPPATTEDQLRAVLLKNPGGVVRANFVEQAGVQVPADFHSWAMVTTFYNFEQSFLYFQKAYDGKLTDELKKAEVLYWASYKDLTVPNSDELHDNALYFSPIKSFMMVPFEKLQKLPLSLNLGVIGHEYAHLVFNKKVYGGAALPAPITSWTLGPFNLLKAMDEGIADFHGFGVTCSTVVNGPGCLPSFLAASFDTKTTDGARTVADRDMTNLDQCMTKELRSAFHNFQPGQWLQQGLHYKLGTLIAASLYQASVPFGKEEQMQKALIESLDKSSPSRPDGFKQLVSLNQQTPANFTPELMANTIAAHVTDLQLKKEVCKQLSDRLQLQCATFAADCMPACIGATRGTRCPTLPPE